MMNTSNIIEFRNLSAKWVDGTTFIFAFDGGIDDEGNEYSISCQYHSDEEMYIFTRWYGEEAADADLTVEQEEYIKSKVKMYIKCLEMNDLKKRIEDCVYEIFRTYDLNRTDKNKKKMEKIVDTCMEDIEQHKDLLILLRKQAALNFFVKQTILHMIKAE